MGNMRAKLYEIYSLEQLSSGNSVLHALHPSAKLLAAFVYIACVVSFGRYELNRLVPYVFYPVVLAALSSTPPGMILKRALVALPFVLFAGVSNLVFDRAVMAHLGGLPISYGAVSLFTLLVRTLLCVAAALLLVATTPFRFLTGQLRLLRVPGLVVDLFEMTYRYLGTLLGEATGMHTAYALRSPVKKGLDMEHMGSFIGQLLLRSFDRAERVYAAMKCRGYPGNSREAEKRRFRAADGWFLLLAAGSSLLFRLADVQGIFVKWLEGVL
ncbi:MAG: cobalt ECF transporter T component CbiQ [Clostridiaceae bacterium]